MRLGAPVELALPVWVAEALSGTEFSQRVAGLTREAREAAVVAEVKSGKVPGWWRRFVDVTLGDAVIAVSPDYVGMATDDDYWLAPLTPGTAQAIADELGCVLPTRKMVEAIWRAAPVKLAPAPIVPGKAMTTVPVFSPHHTTVRAQRDEALAVYPFGTLVAGRKKDGVITPRLETAADRVAIHGWHRLEGTAIQPLYLGHAATWAGYHHGVRLVRSALRVGGRATPVEAVLADPGGRRC